MTRKRHELSGTEQLVLNVLADAYLELTDAVRASHLARVVAPHGLEKSTVQRVLTELHPTFVKDDPCAGERAFEPTLAGWLRSSHGERSRQVIQAALLVLREKGKMATRYRRPSTYSWDEIASSASLARADYPLVDKILTLTELASGGSGSAWSADNGEPFAYSFYVPHDFDDVAQIDNVDALLDLRRRLPSELRNLHRMWRQEFDTRLEFVVRTVYEDLRATGQWPLSRSIERRLRKRHQWSLIDHRSRLVRAGNPDDQSSIASLTLPGLYMLPEAEDDRRAIVQLLSAVGRVSQDDERPRDVGLSELSDLALPEKQIARIARILETQSSTRSGATGAEAKSLRFATSPRMTAFADAEYFEDILLAEHIESGRWPDGEPEVIAAPDPNSRHGPMPSLRTRLTNGELPTLAALPAFLQPEIENAAPSALDRETQVLLLTATKTERDAVLQKLRPRADAQQVQRIFSGAQTYYVGRLGAVDVVLTTCRAGSQPRDGALIVTHEAIARTHPRAVVAVGMAFGGYTNKLKIGDVLVSTHIVPYEPSRKQPDGDLPRGGDHDAGALLLNRFLEARGWTYERSDGHPCEVREGRLLSGEKLVDDLDFKEELFAAHPEAIGGEMEGSGVYAASERSGITEWIVVKAVCDWGDGTKHKGYQAFASAAAVALLEYVFAQPGVLDDLPLRPQRSQQVSKATQSNVVNNFGTTIGTQNVVYGDVTVVAAPSIDIDAVLDAIQTLITKGHEAEALTRLEEADARMWSRMSDAQKARHRALRGLRKVVTGDNTGAARDFFEAHELAPTDEKATSRKCRALMLLDRTREAYETAKAVLDRFPHHPYLRPYLIDAAPPEVPLDQLLPTDWQRLGLTSEEAVAAAHRVRITDLALAEQLLRAVQKPEHDDANYASTLGGVMVEQIHLSERRGDEIPASKREEVLRWLKSAYAEINSPSGREHRGHLALTIAVQSKRLGQADDYSRWFAIAKECIPHEVHLLAERAHEAGDRGDFASAADLLRRVVSSSQRPDLARVVFARALLNLKTSSATSEACSVLEEAASDANEPSRDRQFAALTLVAAQMDFDLEAASASIARHAETLGEYHAERMRLLIAVEAGGDNNAHELATRITANRSRFTDTELLVLGALIGDLRQHPECVDLLEAIAPRTELDRPTIALLNSATALGRHELVISICKALRESGVEDPQIIDGEACMLFLRGDLSAALDLVQRWLAEHPDDKRIRFRLAHIAHELGHHDLLPTRADQMPEPSDARPEIAPDVVRILLAAGAHAEARRFAYSNFKRRRHDEWAWKAVSVAGLRTIHARTEPEDVSTATPELLAGPGMAVLIKERNSARWVQLEESDELVTAPDEYGPTHAMTAALTGKKVGDRVEVHKGQFGLPGRAVVIDAITTCFQRTCQQCNEMYALQFQDSPFVHVFEVPESVDDLVAMLLESAKPRRTSVDRLVRAYGETPNISLHGLADLCDRSVFEVIPFLVASNQLIHAARPPDRMKAGRESLLRTREIVIETTSLSTLAMLELVGRTKPLFSKLWIASATLDRLRSYVHRQVSDGASGHLGLEGEQLFYARKDAASEARRADYLRSLVAAIETWDVFHETDRHCLSSTTWDNWTQIAGGGTADSVHRAKRLGLALWTDDFAIAAAAEHEGVAPISTQAVFETLHSLDVVSRNVLADIGARLVGWGYVDTRTPPESFLAAARLAHWNPSERPLVQHMELMTSAKWPTHAVVMLVTEVFRLWWTETLDRSPANALIVAALIRISARANADAILHNLPGAIRARFGLDVLSARDVTAIIVAWRASQAY